jgi:hypothetical protein
MTVWTFARGRLRNRGGWSPRADIDHSMPARSSYDGSLPELDERFPRAALFGSSLRAPAFPSGFRVRRSGWPPRLDYKAFLHRRVRDGQEHDCSRTIRFFHGLCLPPTPLIRFTPPSRGPRHPTPFDTEPLARSDTFDGTVCPDETLPVNRLVSRRCTSKSASTDSRGSR